VQLRGIPGLRAGAKVRIVADEGDGYHYECEAEVTEIRSPDGSQGPVLVVRNCTEVKSGRVEQGDQEFFQNEIASLVVLAKDSGEEVRGPKPLP